jgi:hypothetical protein
MSCEQLSQSVIGVIVITLFVVGCSSATPAPTSIPPSATPLPPTPLPTVTAIPCAGPPDASAQEFALQIQSRGGNNVASGGVIIRSGKSVSFDSAGKTKSAGFWKSIDNLKYTVLFSDSKGQSLALTELQGDVQWDETSCIIKGAESFIRIMIESDTWLSISKREVVQGQLVLTDEKSNKYVILSFDPSFSGVMAKQ